MSDTITGARQHAERFVAEIDETELAARVMEAAIDLSRPPGMSAAQALSDAERTAPGMAASFRHIAQAAIAYFAECVSNGRQPS